MKAHERGRQAIGKKLTGKSSRVLLLRAHQRCAPHKKTVHQVRQECRESWEKKNLVCSRSCSIRFRRGGAGKPVFETSEGARSEDLNRCQQLTHKSKEAPSMLLRQSASGSATTSDKPDKNGQCAICDLKIRNITRSQNAKSHLIKSAALTAFGRDRPIKPFLKTACGREYENNEKEEKKGGDP